MGKQTEKAYYPYLTFLRVVSMLAVVTLHTNKCFWIFAPEESYWYSANYIESLFYFGVPVFYMVSGISLIDYPQRYSTKEFFTRRLKKTAIPFLAWSLFAVFYYGRSELLLDPVGLTDAILSTRIVGIYWFFTSLFCIYLSMPLFAAVPAERRRETFSYLLFAGFVINSLIPFLLELFQLDIGWPLAINVVDGALLYVPAGILLHDSKLGTRQRLLLYCIGAAALLAHILGTRDLSMQTGRIETLYKGYSNVPCILYSAAVFVFLRQLGERIMQTKAAAVVSKLGGYSFPMFLMHIFILNEFDSIFHPNIYSLVYRLGMPFLIIVIVIPITWILRKIPLLKWTVPE